MDRGEAGPYRREAPTATRFAVHRSDAARRTLIAFAIFAGVIPSLAMAFISIPIAIASLLFFGALPIYFFSRLRPIVAVRIGRHHLTLIRSNGAEQHLHESALRVDLDPTTTTLSLGVGQFSLSEFSERDSCLFPCWIWSSCCC
jgi:hypothetical protein